jgi:hypothetical protein
MKPRIAPERENTRERQREQRVTTRARFERSHERPLQTPQRRAENSTGTQGTRLNATAPQAFASSEIARRQPECILPRNVLHCVAVTRRPPA